MKKINVGIIGCGYWGPNLVKNFFNNQKCVVKKIADLSENRLSYIKSLYHDIEITLDLNEIIKDPEIDAVVLATPVNTHKEIGMLAFNSNKHVFIEKPLTDNTLSAEELVNKAKSVNKILAVGHIFQFAPAVKAIKTEVENGLLGNIFRFNSQRINLGPPKTTVDVVWDLGPHDLSILLYIFNEKPNYVSAYGGSFWWKGIIDNADVILNFPSGRIANLHLSWLSSKKTRKITIFGEKGNLDYDETLVDEDKVIFFDKGIDNRINVVKNEIQKLHYGVGEVKKIVITKEEPLALEVDAFLNAILTDKQPINDGVIGKEVVEILETVSKSIREKR
jgi:predicted dehydrogenase